MSRLPPEFGDVPAGVVIEGLDKASPEARRIFAQNQGAVTAFHSKARQARGDLPAYSMQQAIPGGGRIRYTYNNGLEMIHVRVPVPTREELAEEQEPRKRFAPEPVIAIDVLIEPDQYAAGDVYAHTLESGGGGGGDPWDQSAWSTIYDAGDSFLDFYPGHGEPPSYAWVFGPHQASTGPGIMTGFPISTGDVVPFDISDTSQPFQSPYVSWGATFSGVDWISAKFWHVAAADGSGGSGDLQQNTLDKLWLYDVTNAIGVVGDPEGDQPYQAINVENFDGPAQDARLTYQANAAPRASIARDVEVDAEAPPGLTGACFIARPVSPIQQGVKPGAVTLDIYLASNNTKRSNTFPGPEGETVEDDDPSLTYDFDPDLRFRVRVREYIYGAPGVVEVAATTQDKTEHFVAAPSEPPGGDPASASSEVSTEPRVTTWQFAADKNWIDLGGEPADPTAHGMGVMLADSGPLAKTVVGPDPLEHKIYDAPEWHADVRTMTKVATVTWHPSEREGTHGSAEIVPT